MKHHHSRSLTLIELLLAVALIWLVVLAVSNIDLFSRGYILNADRRTRLQNDLSLVADDICKNVVQAVGSPAGTWAVYETGSGSVLNVNKAASTSPVTYTLSTVSYVKNGNKIQKNGVDLNILGAVTVFDFDPVDNGIGVNLTITGIYDPAQPASVNNPEITVYTKCYSRQASAE